MLLINFVLIGFCFVVSLLEWTPGCTFPLCSTFAFLVKTIKIEVWNFVGIIFIYFDCLILYLLFGLVEFGLWYMFIVFSAWFHLAWKNLLKNMEAFNLLSLLMWSHLLVTNAIIFQVICFSFSENSNEIGRKRYFIFPSLVWKNA